VFILILALAMGLCFTAPVSPQVRDIDYQVTLPEEKSGHISINVNAGPENTGRFSVYTTTGDPYRSGDENMPLIYGSAGGSPPWTSYSTIRLNGENYVFGGPTSKRAGRQAKSARVVTSPTVTQQGAIKTVCMIKELRVTQILSVTTSTTTGLPDTACVRYLVENTGSGVQQVGLRIMLDTMLGANDGAPFRVRESALTTDTLITGDDIPQLWQAFDSLSEPRVMAQGTLRGPGVTTPDAVLFTNWGKLADEPWELPVEPGRDFTRKGEFELDSAVALRWDESPLAPGESKEYVTLYGLAGITIIPGNIVIGTSAPAEIQMEAGRPPSFPIIGYIENTGKGEARDLVAEIRLPHGLELVDCKRVRELPDLPVGETLQVTWLIRLREDAHGVLRYSLDVRSSNSDPNSVQRSIRVISPPRLHIRLDMPDQITTSGPAASDIPFPVTATITNVGGSAARHVRVNWACNPGLFYLADGDLQVKYIGSIPPGEKHTVTFFLIPANVSGHQIPFDVTVEAANAVSVMKHGFVNVTSQPGVTMVAMTPGTSTTLKPGDYFTVHLQASGMRCIRKAVAEISYDPTYLRVVGDDLGIDPTYLQDWDVGEDRIWETAVDSRKGTITVVADTGMDACEQSQGFIPVTKLRAVTLLSIRFQVCRVPDSKTPVNVELVRGEITDGRGRWFELTAHLSVPVSPED